MGINQIKIYEIYVEEADNVDKMVAWFFENSKGIEHKYFCRYENDAKSKYFLRIGFINPTKKFMSSFEKKIKTASFFMYHKQWLENPNTKEWDLELMKFLAYKNFINIINHFKEFKDYYLKSNQRVYNEHRIRVKTNQEKLEMWFGDWMNMLHHTFNMLGYSYMKETNIYGKAFVHFNSNSILSQLKS